MYIYIHYVSIHIYTYEKHIKTTYNTTYKKHVRQLMKNIYRYTYIHIYIYTHTLKSIHMKKL